MSDSKNSDLNETSLQRTTSDPSTTPPCFAQLEAAADAVADAVEVVASTPPQVNTAIKSGIHLLCLSIVACLRCRRKRAQQQQSSQPTAPSSAPMSTEKKAQ